MLIKPMMRCCSGLRSSISKYGLVQNLVVRRIGDKYEVLSGNQRLKLLREFNVKIVPGVIVDLDDAHARLLAQALNHIHGDDDWDYEQNSFGK